MKKLFLFAAVGIFIVSSFSFLPANNKGAATAGQGENGLYMFIESQPASPYEKLGEVKKTGLVWNGKAPEMVKILCRRAKDDYPGAEGIIFDDLGLDHATVIRFK